MNVIVTTGWRNYDLVDPIREALEGQDLLIVGCCKTGADDIARRLAEKMGIKVAVFRADWHPKHLNGRFHAAAGPARNFRMAQAARRGVEAGHNVRCVAFTNPNAKEHITEAKRSGTADCVRRLRLQGLHVLVGSIHGELLAPLGPPARP